MDRYEYWQPGTFQVGNRYFLISRQNGSGKQFTEVVFIGYRPHPGEIIVDDGTGPQVVHRHYLYRKNDPASS
jgi:ABC-type siderophore export system fused ATPase/permease subunit